MLVDSTSAHLHSGSSKHARRLYTLKLLQTDAREKAFIGQSPQFLGRVDRMPALRPHLTQRFPTGSEWNARGGEDVAGSPVLLSKYTWLAHLFRSSK